MSSVNHPGKCSGEGCRLCKLAATDPRYQKLWGIGEDGKRTPPQKLLLRNHLSPGDCLVMTAALECLHRQHPRKYVTGVDCPVMAIYENNPWVKPMKEGEEGVRVVDMQYPLIHSSNQRLVPFLQGYVDFLADQLGIKLICSVNRPYVYISKQEKEWASQVEETTGKKTRFWVIVSGGKNDFSIKWYPFYQEVIDRLLGRVQFAQVGETSHHHPPLRGTINLVGKTDTRQLIRLMHHCEGFVGPTTFMTHLAAAFQKPAVTLIGGREPIFWCQYPWHTVLHTIGALSCCKHSACWRSRTVPLADGSKQDFSLCEQPVYLPTPAARCMTLITPDDVVRVVQRYIDGGAVSVA
jgi:ADP-heptose:LPS heptosyltransferase